MQKEYRRASDRTYHLVYKTTCLNTGRFYIGLHSADDLEDDYLGSGLRLRRSIKKYGVAAHKREIIQIFKTRAEASNYEKEILTEKLIKDPECLNCGPGGLGAVDRSATSEETKLKLSIASKNYVRTKEWYEKTVSTRKLNNSYFHTPETKAKIGLANSGRKLSEETKAKIGKAHLGMKRPPSVGQKISERAKIRKELGIKMVRKPVTDEARENIRLSRLGKKHSEKAKLKMSMTKQQKRAVILRNQNESIRVTQP